MAFFKVTAVKTLNLTEHLPAGLCSGEVMCLLVRYELGFYIPEVGILHGYRRENLRSYKEPHIISLTEFQADSFSNKFG
jgi:hypothetical protein